MPKTAKQLKRINTSSSSCARVVPCVRGSPAKGDGAKGPRTGRIPIVTVVYSFSSFQSVLNKNIWKFVGVRSVSGSQLLAGRTLRCKRRQWRYVRWIVSASESSIRVSYALVAAFQVSRFPTISTLTPSTFFRCGPLVGGHAACGLSVSVSPYTRRFAVLPESSYRTRENGTSVHIKLCRRQ